MVFYLLQNMYECMGDWYTRGANFSMVHWIWTSSKSLLHILHDAVFSKIGKVNQVLINLYFNDLVGMDVTMLQFVHDGKLIKANSCERRIVMKAISSLCIILSMERTMTRDYLLLSY